MKSIVLTEEKDGFCGVFRPIHPPAILLVTVDEADSIIAKAALKWANKILGISALSISPNKEMKGMHNWPLEHVEKSVHYVKDKGYSKIGIWGISAGSNMALNAASRIEEITLTIALSPIDFVMWGYINDGKQEQPVVGESVFTWRNSPVPHMPPPCEHPDYWEVAEKEKRRRGDLVAAKDLFDMAEEKHPLDESILIKVENIHGRLLLAGSEDDVLWNTCRAIKRMKQRLEEMAPPLTRVIVDTCLYDHCTHFIFPESMIKTLIPITLFNFILPRVFKEAKGFKKECQQSRMDLDQRIQSMVKEWLK